MFVGLTFFLYFLAGGGGGGALSESESDIFCKNLRFLGGGDDLFGDFEDLRTLLGEVVTTGPFWEGPEDKTWSDFTTVPFWEGPEVGATSDEEGGFGILASENKDPYLSGIATFNLS